MRCSPPSQPPSYLPELDRLLPGSIVRHKWRGLCWLKEACPGWPDFLGSWAGGPVERIRKAEVVAISKALFSSGGRPPG